MRLCFVLCHAVCLQHCCGQCSAWPLLLWHIPFLSKSSSPKGHCGVAWFCNGHFVCATGAS